LDEQISLDPIGQSIEAEVGDPNTRCAARKKAHCAYRYMYHIVWIPRYGYKILVNGVDEYLKIKMDEVRKHYPEIEYPEILSRVVFEKHLSASRWFIVKPLSP
jgi:hypothetical protein